MSKADMDDQSICSVSKSTRTIIKENKAIQDIQGPDADGPAKSDELGKYWIISPDTIVFWFHKFARTAMGVGTIGTNKLAGQSLHTHNKGCSEEYSSES